VSRNFAIWLLATFFLTTVSFADAQQPKIPRIGYLSGQQRSDGPELARLQAFREGLRDLGYVEAKNIFIEYRHAEGNVDRINDLAADLVRLKVDVILTAGEAQIRAAKQATSIIPIVMGLVGDAVEQGFVASLARPGGNITGLSILAHETAGKRLELLKETVPRAARVAVLWNAAHKGKALELKNTEIVAQALKVHLQPVEVREPKDFARAFADIAKASSQALITLSEGLTRNHRKQIADFATKNRLPMIAELKEYAEAGGLMTYGPDEPELFRRAATYVDKILKGAKPADLPVEQPTKFEFVINLKTAKQIGLTIPQSVLYRADRVIR
jgi:putative ABC transport system substrate-binding protein